MNSRQWAAGFHRTDLGTLAAQVAYDVAEILFRRHNLEFHDRFKQYRFSSGDTVFQRHRTGNLECHFIRVAFVGAPVNKGPPDVDDRITRHNTAFQSLFNTGLDRGHEVSGYGIALKLLGEKEAGTGFTRFDFKPAMTVLTMTAALADEPAFGTYRLGDCLSVGNARLAN